MTDNVPLLTNEAGTSITEQLQAAWVESDATIPELLARMGITIKHGEPDWERQYQYLHRRLTGAVPLIKVDPALVPLAKALGLDPAGLIASAIEAIEMAKAYAAGRGAR